jgi:hypothetical protein
MTRSLRDMILGALDVAGGQAHRAEQAHQNPAAFLTLLGRVLPRVRDKVIFELSDCPRRGEGVFVLREPSHFRPFGAEDGKIFPLDNGLASTRQRAKAVLHSGDHRALLSAS